MSSSTASGSQVKLTSNRVFATKVTFQLLDLLAEIRPSLQVFPEPVIRLKHREVDDPDIAGTDVLYMVDKQHKLEISLNVSKIGRVIRATIDVTATIGPQVETFLGHAIDKGDGHVHTEIDPPEPPIS
jgi:hypothetical protein